MLINGLQYSWTSVQLTAFAQAPTDFDAIKFSDSIDGRERVYGAGPLPRGHVRGKYKPGDGSVTFLKSGWAHFLSTMPTGYGEILTDIVIQYSENAGADIHTVVLEECQIGGVDESESEGTDPSKVEVALHFNRISRDGKYLMEAVAPVVSL